MDDGEIDFSADREVFADCSSFYSAGLGPIESFLDDLLMNSQSCTHTHTCNPPGPDNTHTHTCFHTHTQLFAPLEDDTTPSSSLQPSSRKRPIGNKEAVRKYREKKKAHTAFLEDEVLQLRTLNQQLLKRLQGQVALEAEVVRLKGLLLEFRGRIDGELLLSDSVLQASAPTAAVDGPVSHQKGSSTLQPLPGGFFLNSVDVSCNDVPCLLASTGNTTGPTTLHEQQSLRGGPCEKVLSSCPGHSRRKARKEANTIRPANTVRQVFPDQ